MGLKKHAKDAWTTFSDQSVQSFKKIKNKNIRFLKVSKI